MKDNYYSRNIINALFLGGKIIAERRSADFGDFTNEFSTNTLETSIFYSHLFYGAFVSPITII